ncbi:LTA synthase family protein [Paenibacillus vulneris]|uniref:LTA synthase family protein n=1 Tax=Paenibacillus vulneris TaxID=1133364 RepID=A0ABW3UED5_9BACL
MFGFRIKFKSIPFLYLVLTLLLLLLLESIVRTSFIEALSWIFSNIKSFLLNYVISLGLFFVLYSIIGRIRITFCVNAIIYLIIALISQTKVKYLGIPLLPSDLFLFNEGTDIVQYLNGVFSPDILLIIAINALIILCILWLYKSQQRTVLDYKKRIILLCVGLVILVPIHLDRPFQIKNLFGIQDYHWDQLTNYNANGFMLATGLNLETIFVKEPGNYGPENIANIINSIEKKNIISTVEPNIIVILSEAFWDPTVMKEVSFSQDPLPFFHKLEKQYSSGKMLSPVFGGGTANVEFEVLTGNSTRFLRQGSIAYNDYINSEIDSLASILSRQGYYPTVFSAFDNWFYNQRKVYNYMGFAQFISSEFFDKKYKGPFLADSEVGNMIIKQTGKTKGPDFIFAATMQNHGTYGPDRYEENTITVTKGDLSEESKKILETYLQGLVDADKMLEQLVNYYEHSDEPTIIAFYGDHLPILGDDYKVYKEAKYINNDKIFNSFSDVQKMYNVPLLIWNNYMNSEKEDLYMSPSFLGTYLLNLADLKGSYYTDYLYSIYKKNPVIPNEVNYQELNIDPNKLEDYAKLQYDILFGKKYAYSQLNLLDKIANPRYKLGEEAMEITGVSPSEIQAGVIFNQWMGKSAIAVQGKNILPGSVLYINDQPLETTYGDKGFITAIVPDNFYSKAGILDLQIKLFDSKKILVSESNKVKVKVKSQN